MLSRSTRQAFKRAFSTLPNSADVVVVGGGVVGCSTAMALAKRGVNVVLLEQNGLTQGTTWHAAGLLGTLKSSRLGSAMAIYGSNFYEGLEDVGFHNTGSLAIARNKNTWETLLHSYQIGKSMGRNHVLVTPQEIKDRIHRGIHPFMNVDGVIGGIHSPDDGIVNPGDGTIRIAQIAKQHGAQIFENTQFLGTSNDGRKVTTVKTTKGDIHCGHVFVGGGLWTKDAVRQIYGGAADVIPLAMAPHQYIIFDQVKGVDNTLPVVRDADNKTYIKPEVGGFMVGTFEGDPYPHLPDAVRERNRLGKTSPEICNEVFEESLEKQCDPWFENVVDSFPVLQETGMKSVLHGPDSHSADHSPIMGRLPGFDNAWVSCGYNSQGIQNGPGTGLAMSEWILDGYPHTLDTDFASADVQRFYPKLCADHEHCEMRALEGYGKVYGAHFPREFFESSRGHRFSPLHDRLTSKGAVYGDGYGWERALYFLDGPPKIVEGSHATLWKDRYQKNGVKLQMPEGYSFRAQDTEFFEAEKAECLAARSSAAVFDLSAFGKIKVSGKDAERALQYACSADVSKAPGGVTYTTMLNHNGGIQGDFTVCRKSEDEFYVVTVSFQPDLIKDHFSQHFGGFSDVKVEDVTEDFGAVALMGPKAKAILSQLVDNPSLLEDSVQPPFSCFPINVAGVPCYALRVSFIGEIGWELHAPAEETGKVYDALFATAGSSGVPLKDAGTFALLESLRVEKMFVHFGHDVTPAENPLEAGLGFACKLKTDVDFVGRKALEAYKAKYKAAPKQRMVWN